ncbi:hypothetical protein [Bradyrhizobium sp. DASA03120]|uniref:hypothetical protein n=1 Tax=Bradyrhizobium sp. SMVTL-02 TaxID=3395917 RepID=UPI003F7107D2
MAEGEPHPLSLRPTLIGGDTAEGDYTLMREGRPIGRIRLTQDHIVKGTVWAWTITVPLPTPAWSAGGAESLEAAKVAFREAWERFYASLSERDIALWHLTEDSSRPGWR